MTSNAILYAFDLLYLDSHDPRVYRSRRHLLESALADVWRGIVGENRDQPYQSS